MRVDMRWLVGCWGGVGVGVGVRGSPDGGSGGCGWADNIKELGKGEAGGRRSGVRPSP